jgi:hypothetical protein
MGMKLGLRVLRKKFEPNRDEVTGGWRKQHNAELHNLWESLKKETSKKTKT